MKKIMLIFCFLTSKSILEKNKRFLDFKHKFVVSKTTEKAINISKKISFSLMLVGGVISIYDVINSYTCYVDQENIFSITYPSGYKELSRLMLVLTILFFLIEVYNEWRTYEKIKLYGASEVLDKE